MSGVASFIGPPVALAGQSISWQSTLMPVDGARVEFIVWDVRDAWISASWTRENAEWIFSSSDVILSSIPFMLSHALGWGRICTRGSRDTRDPFSQRAAQARSIDSAFRTQTRGLGSIDHQADSVRLIVYFDISDQASALQLNVEDFLRRPPISMRLGVYSRFRPHPQLGQPYDPAVGRRESGVFRSLRELFELAGDIGRLPSGG
jgi:hypothetical protein